ncbi:MAG: hypothetical protein ACJA1Z_000917 [Patiriisocius sp.]|jgi:hypothetical protein
MMGPKEVVFKGNCQFNFFFATSESANEGLGTYILGS